ncbi:10484_t:CDS:1 [Ambispora leptoticha]|uniref:10484_t:CDS:1 n=1 Tax=Ambispora leptoticha TaxID=144679 RepID=A0A9N9A749_9GLOM|nr:10484_t:CDS:1 [Ambispora leptoticha]
MGSQISTPQKSTQVVDPKVAKTLELSTQVVGPKVVKTLELFEHENVKEHFTNLYKYKGKVIHAISVDYPETGDNSKTKIADRHTYTHGFVSAIHEAYNLHQHLRLKPDDVWLTIAQGVSEHINLNAEKFRSYFVEHEGKKSIKVYAGDILRYTNSRLEGDWPEVVHRLENATSENIEKMDLPKILECDFSTSTMAAKTASRVILLDALKQYFNYEIVTRCGIPKVTLEGTLEDWVHIQEKVVNLRNLGLDMDFWLDRLEPVIWKLVATYRGKIDEKFWSKVFSKKGGGRSGRPSYWTGWITAFFPYDKLSRKITTNKIITTGIPDGRVNVPFVTDLDLYLSFSAGFLGARQELVGSGDDAEVYVSPLIGWFVVDRDKDEKNNSN